jgi:hypothetical protein
MPTGAYRCLHMPTHGSGYVQEPMEQNTLSLEGIRICTSHRLDSEGKQFSIFFPTRKVWQEFIKCFNALGSYLEGERVGRQRTASLVSNWPQGRYDAGHRLAGVLDRGLNSVI